MPLTDEQIDAAYQRTFNEMPGRVREAPKTAPMVYAFARAIEAAAAPQVPAASLPPLLQQALDALVRNNNEWKSLADSGDAGFWKAEEQPCYQQTDAAITALRAALAPSGAAPQGETEAVKAFPFGWLFEGPELRQFAKSTDCVKPVIDLHMKMAQAEPAKYKMTPLYAAPPSPLTQEVDADKRDAERYRFLRAASQDDEALESLANANPEPRTDEEFDAAVDAAIQAEKGKP